MAPAASQSAAPAGPQPTAVTELPLPPSKNPEAVAAFASGMQGFRDGNWGYVEDSMSRAVQLDPGLAAAHLRLAIMRVQARTTLAEARASYALAVLGRGSLSERDQVLLAAYEPLIGREPPSMYEWVERLRAASDRYPGDAELAVLYAYADMDHPEEAMRAAQRSADIDPQYADAWQAVGKYLFDTGNTEQALVALD